MLMAMALSTRQSFMCPSVCLFKCLSSYLFVFTTGYGYTIDEDFLSRLFTPPIQGSKIVSGRDLAGQETIDPVIQHHELSP